MSVSTTPQRTPKIMAWVIMLLVSMLPNIFWFELVNENTRWLFWTKMALLAGLAITSFFWGAIKPLRKYILILFFIFALEEIVSNLANLPLWQQWFGKGDATFVVDMFGIQLRRLIVTLLLVGVMFLLGYNRKQIFLQRGDLKAPIEPVRWLGFPKTRSVDALWRPVCHLYQPGDADFSNPG